MNSEPVQRAIGRFVCGHCEYETDSLNEIREHVDTHDRDAICNWYLDRRQIPIKNFRFTPRIRRTLERIR